MNISDTRVGAMLIGALWMIAAGLPAVADDTELFIYNNFESGGQPNVLFIVDNSAAMGSAVSTQDNYFPSTTYDKYADCDPDRIYWSTKNKTPVCSSRCTPSSGAGPAWAASFI